MKQADSKVLGQILLLQSAIAVAADSNAIGEQTCHVLRGIPGLAGSALRANGAVVAEPVRGVPLLDDYIQRCESTPADSLRDEFWPQIEVFSLQTSHGIYGDLILDVSDREEFSPYAPFLQNTANMIALVLENWSQASALHDLNVNLEAQVCKRTQALKESEERNRLVIQASNEGIWDWDLRTNDVFYSHRWKEMLGYADSELENRIETWRKVIHPDDLKTVEVLLKAHIEDGKPFSHKSRYFHRDGSLRWIHANCFVLRDNEGKAYRIVGNHRDVTDEQIAQDVMKQAKDAAEAANLAKDQFIAVLSHELRTPLTPVLAAATSLVTQEHLPGEVIADLEIIHRNVELETKLIDDLLDVTQISRGKIQLHQEVVDSHASLQAALEICQEEIRAKHLEVSSNLQANQHLVWADPARLQQVFWNLLKNAVKFTPENGKISMRTLNVDRRLHIEISDTGIGIDPAVLPHIFDTFEQGERTKNRQFGGLGLGLSIAKAVVELHHGTINVDSGGKDKGATFRVELSTVLEESLPRLPSTISPLPQKRALKILLVEDNADTLRILARLLQKWDYTVTTADCVRTTLEKAASEPFDLLVSDLGLPDGSGLDIMRQVKSLYGLRGIALSGFGTDEDIRESRAAGFEEHLVKPVGFQVLQQAIEYVTSEAA